MTEITRRFTLLALPLAALAACAKRPDQYLLETPVSALRLPSVVGSIQLHDISLPRYANDDSLVSVQSDGALKSDRNAVWADVPQRSMTLALARNLAAITGARVATDPWPFAAAPQATLSVTVEQFARGTDGILRLTGSFALAPLAAAVSDRDGRFSISLPVPEDSAAAIAAAHGKAVETLAETIARRIAR